MTAEKKMKTAALKKPSWSELRFSHITKDHTMPVQKMATV